MKKIILVVLSVFFLNGLLNAQCAGNCTLYTLSSIAPAIVPSAGTSVVLGDDQVSGALPIGFTFNFMCNAYTNFYLSSNGFISFNPAVSQGCCSGQVIPSPGNAVNNFIAWDWNDLYPPGAGTMQYQTIGVAPNRICIITCSSIPHCCNAGPAFNTGQIKLYETTNVIEVHSGVITTDGSTATQGIMDQSGNVAYPVAGRNGVTWTATSDASRWTPSAASPSCVGTPTPGSAVCSPSMGCGTYTSNLSLVGSVSGCSVTYQWQSATNPGGPYTNIAGATASVANITNTVTTYYQCVLSCGGSTAASTSGTCNNVPCACVGNCSLYTVSSIPVAMQPNAGTSVVLGDDQVSAAIPIGFNFNFMCGTYSNVYISSNGFISFDPAVSQGCCSGQLCPTASGNPDNYIAAVWNDLYPPGGGTIKYQTLGVAPNRQFVVTYSVVPFCCNAGPPNISSQIILYESTNVIEIHDGVVGNQGSNATQGIANAAGTAGFPAPGRNSVAWTANNDAYRWSPSPALPPCVGTPTPGSAQASPSTACATFTSNLSLVGSVQSCSLTYQWQSATAPGGPYANIAGATSSLVNVTNTVTTYYQCVLSCGGSTAVSTTASCVIPPCAGTPTPGTAVANPTTACVTANSNLSLTGTVAACGLTYQWQRALAPGGPYTNIAGATSITAAVTSTVTNYYRCIVSCGGNTAASVPATVSITPGPCPTCIGQYYVHSNIGDPWGSPTNANSMNAVFGATWTAAFYETVNVAAMLQPTISFIFLEGGDNNATAMNTFVTNNIVALQTWVSNGGHLLMNSAPNVGGNMVWGFGGVNLNYPNFSTPGTAVNPAHPIFNGPYLPAGTAFTGTWWSHSTVTGGGIVNVINGTAGSTLAELNYGLGIVMFGGMTTYNFHSPVPNSQNLLQNIFVYLNCAPVPLPLELTDYSVNYNGEYAAMNWITASEKNTDYFVIDKSFDGVNYTFLDKIPAAGNSTDIKKYLTKDLNPNKNGLTYYRLKQFDKGSSIGELNLVKTLYLSEKAKGQIKVQPNPASSYLDVYLPESFLNKALTLQVFDNSGKRALSVSISKLLPGAAYNLNIESLTNGFYSLQIFDETGGSAKTTFIKE